MDVLEVIARLEQSGGTLTLDGDRVKYHVPTGDGHIQKLLSELRKHRYEVTAFLRQRPAIGSVQPLPDERRFGQPHAKLFPYIGYKVRTPKGPATLIQVFADRCTVLLETDMDRCSSFLPGEIRPIAIGEQ